MRVAGVNSAGEWLFETLGGPADRTEEWYSNGAGGLALHKTFDPATQGWSVFNTPLRILAAEFQVGDSLATVVVEVEVADGSETNAITTLWLAKNVGVVRATFEEGAQTSELNLVATDVPEPGLMLLALAALSALAGLRSGRGDPASIRR